MKPSVLLAIFLLFNPLSLMAQKAISVDPDPLESINRPIFAFNDGLDRVFIRPLAVGYDTITPRLIKHGVGNIFSNTADLTTALNSALQGDFQRVGSSSARFLVNSTLGFFGIFDVATEMGLTVPRTDFGHTLAVWGVSSGPYLMIPLFGPRTFRSGTGSIFDTFFSMERQIDNVALRNSLLSLELLDGRTQLLKSDDLVSGDRYIFVRDAYLQRRDVLVNDNSVIDTFEYELDEEF